MKVLVYGWGKIAHKVSQNDMGINRVWIMNLMKKFHNIYSSLKECDEKAMSSSTFSSIN